MPADIHFEQALSDFLADESTVRVMVAASEAGRPAVEAIGSDLLRVFGDRVRPNPVKQHIGRLVRPIMESHGFEPYKRRRQVKSTLFMAGTVYRRESEPIISVLARHGFKPPSTPFAAKSAKLRAPSSAIRLSLLDPLSTGRGY